MGVNIIDSFFVALGYKVDSKGLDEFQRKAGGVRDSILSMGTAITAAVGAIAAKTIADIGNQFEQNKIQIAGFLSALGVSSDFNSGLEDAAKIINQITLDAAKLPGSAEEYVDVFKAGLPFLVKALPGGSQRDMADFTNKFTAIGKTLGVDADQIGRDLNLMIGPTGRAGQHVKTFQQMVPFMRQVKGQANLTAQSFNAMTATKRVELLKAAFVPLQPMLEASANSFDAMWGAFKSGLKQVTRLASSGIFEGMKRGLDKLNAMFVDSQGNLTEFGKRVVDTGKTIGRAIVQLVQDGAVLVGWLVDLYHHGPLAKAALAGVAIAILGIKNALAGGVLGVVLLLVDDLIQLQTGGTSVIGMLLDKFPVATRVAGFALAALGGAMVAFKLRAVASMVAVAAANVAAFAPFYAAGAAIALVALAIYEVYQNWDQLMGAIRSGPHDLAVALGFGSASDTAARSAQQAAFGRGASASGADVIWRNPKTGLEETHPPGWIPPTPTMTGAQAAVGGATTTTQTNVTNVTGNTFQIDGSKDPKATADAIIKKLAETAQQVTRNGQTGIHL